MVAKVGIPYRFLYRSFACCSRSWGGSGDRGYAGLTVSLMALNRSSCRSTGNVGVMGWQPATSAMSGVL